MLKVGVYGNFIMFFIKDKEKLVIWHVILKMVLSETWIILENIPLELLVFTGNKEILLFKELCYGEEHKFLMNGKSIIVMIISNSKN